MTSDADKVRAMLQRLERWWWSDQPPEFYTAPGPQGSEGLGELAKLHPGLYNLAWACVRSQGDPATVGALFRPMLEVKLLSIPVLDWATLHRPDVVLAAVREEKKLSLEVRKLLTECLSAAIKAQNEVQRAK